MIPIVGKNFRHVHPYVKEALRTRSKIVDSGTWQSVPTVGRPEMMTHEVEDVIIEFPLYSEELEYHRVQIGGNFPWVDNHFERDRVSGEPLNPGHTWSQWPYSNKANSFREELLPGWEPQFNHTYAERYWPRYAGLTDRGETNARDHGYSAARGIRYNYGDLNDVVNLLLDNPGTRAAYLPVWFPEDTGAVHGGRTPCSLGYLFRMRDRKLSVSYHIRSCDFVRHFQDDVYLTVRLLLWVLDRCREAKSDPWTRIAPGNFLMHIGSLHIFLNDWPRMFPQ